MASLLLCEACRLAPRLMVLEASQLTQKRLAGHSKWKTIMHTKAARDQERAKLAEKYTRLMRVAIKDGGSADPFKNGRLAGLIEQAKSVNLPMSTIQNVLKSTQNKDMKSSLMEIRALGGCFLLLDIMTDNPVRTKQELNTVLKKHGGQWCEGSAKHFFEQKGVIRLVAREGETLEAAETRAIEAGAEEVTEVEPSEDENTPLFQFLCDPADFGTVRNNLAKEENCTLDHAEIEFLPVNCVTLRDNEMQAIVKLIQKLQDHPDVIKVYNNVE